MTSCWRIIENEPLDAYMNMALDEALFESFCSQPYAKPIFRIYRWKSPAFSIGVSQKPQDILDLDKCRAQNLAYVRRITGGGIILHDQEITYSLVIPQGFCGSPRAISASFKAICEFLLIFYRKLGLNPSFAVNEPYNGVVGRSSQFCFAGREKYDIVIKGKKIGGNAQKRSTKAIFQHGSIPLDIDRALVEKFTSLECTEELRDVAALGELVASLDTVENLIRRLKDSFIEAFKIDACDSILTQDELFSAQELNKEKYSTDLWNITRYDTKRSKKASVA